MSVDVDIPDMVELGPDEKILHFLHRSFFSFLFPFILIIASFGTYIAISVIGSILNIFFNGLTQIFLLIIAVLIIGSLLLFGVVILVGGLIGYFYTRGHVYIVTNKRIVLYKKFITKTLRELKYSKISDTVFYQGPLGRLLGYSTISLTTPGMEGGFSPKGAMTFLISLNGIKDGLGVRQDIIDLLSGVE